MSFEERNLQFCNFCKIKRHFESTCRKKARQRSTSLVRHIDAALEILNAIEDDKTSSLKLNVSLKIGSHHISFKLDAAVKGNFISVDNRKLLGKPCLHEPTLKFQSASLHNMPIKESWVEKVAFKNITALLTFFVADVPDLNLLGRKAIEELCISVDEVLHGTENSVLALRQSDDSSLKTSCIQVCGEFEDLFKPELGCLRDFELEVEFKDEAKPVFCKPRSIPFAMQEDLAVTYKAGISRGIWPQIEFNDWGTPVVPIRKKQTGSKKPKLRICGDYSVTVNPKLAVHRYPLFTSTTEGVATILSSV